jgi:hypothetical protein
VGLPIVPIFSIGPRASFIILERISVVTSIARLAGSIFAVAVFGFAATALYVQAAQLPSATSIDAQDDPLQNTSMFVRSDRPATRHPMEEGRQPQSESLTNWHYTGRPIPSQFQIF